MSKTSLNRQNDTAERQQEKAGELRSTMMREEMMQTLLPMYMHEGKFQWIGGFICNCRGQSRDLSGHLKTRTECAQFARRRRETTCNLMGQQSEELNSSCLESQQHLASFLKHPSSFPLHYQQTSSSCLHVNRFEKYQTSQRTITCSFLHCVAMLRIMLNSNCEAVSYRL